MSKEKQFYDWLYNVKKKKNGEPMSERTVLKYTKAINTISDDMIVENIVDRNLYNINSPLELDKLCNIILSNSYFVEKNLKGHNMYSVALQHYIDFIRKD